MSLFPGQRTSPPTKVCVWERSGEPSLAREKTHSCYRFVTEYLYYFLKNYLSFYVFLYVDNSFLTNYGVLKKNISKKTF